MELKKLKILVVDDDEAYNTILTEIVGGKCAQVFSALNGKLALQIIAGNVIDLVISDVQMPVMDGVALTKKLREGGSETPIVLLATGQSTLDEQGAKAIGADGLIMKPFKIAILVKTLEDLAGKVPG
jgi:CheY-like chemotaxis protein